VPIRGCPIFPVPVSVFHRSLFLFRIGGSDDRRLFFRFLWSALGVCTVAGPSLASFWRSRLYLRGTVERLSPLFLHVRPIYHARCCQTTPPGFKSLAPDTESISTPFFFLFGAIFFSLLGLLLAAWGHLPFFLPGTCPCHQCKCPLL